MEERPDCKYIADCCDNSGEFRCLCLENELPLLMQDFKEWVIENGMTPDTICYAHVVDNSGPKLKLIANLVLTDDGEVELVTVSKKRLRHRR